MPRTDAVMDKNYVQKMNNLLSEASVCRKVTKDEGKKEAAWFKKARDLLLWSARGKRLSNLLEEAPATRS